MMITIDLEGIPKRKGIYIVGGSLRDRLLNREPIDIDIAVQGDPEQLARQIAANLNSRAIPMGRCTHRMFRVVTRNQIFDISALQGPRIEDDLMHRDFTVNALAYEIRTRSIIDISRGLQDIHEKRIRLVSETCFQADPLRLLRAFRIAAQLGFQIEKKTLRSLKRNAPGILRTAGERIRSELFGILAAPESHDWIRKMADTGVLFHVLPEMKAMIGCIQNRHHAFDVFEHTIQTLYQMDILIHCASTDTSRYRSLVQPMHTHRRIRLKLAALLHDIGKPLSRLESPDGHTQFPGHESTGARMTAVIGNRLKFSRKETEHAVRMVQSHLRPLHLSQAKRQKNLTRRGIARFFLNTRGMTADILLMSLADMRAKKPADPTSRSEFEQFLAELTRQYSTHCRLRHESPPLINGYDLINHLHLIPSPLFKEILDRTRERQLAGQIASREEALALAAKMASQSSH
jgi:poly(A) polymerase